MISVPASESATASELDVLCLAATRAGPHQPLHRQPAVVYDGDGPGVAVGALRHGDFDSDPARLEHAAARSGLCQVRGGDGV